VYTEEPATKQIPSADFVPGTRTRHVHWGIIVIRGTKQRTEDPDKTGSAHMPPINLLSRQKTTSTGLPARIVFRLGFEQKWIFDFRENENFAKISWNILKIFVHLRENCV